MPPETMSSKKPPLDLTDLSIDTLAVRAGQNSSEFREHSEAIHVTSSFTFDSAEQAARVFADDEAGFVYSRFSNPTISSFEEKLATLEAGETCVATSSGMSAILGFILANYSSGQHIVSSRFVFGATKVLFDDLLVKFGISVSYVDGINIEEWLAALQDNTGMVFFETPSNPTMTLIDIQEVSRSIKAVNKSISVVVDNCFCSPIIQQPILLGADVVVHSATKFIDGQGRCIGGAVVGPEELVGKPMQKLMRTAGLSTSPFNAWVFSKGLETLGVRVRQASENALTIASAFEASGQFLSVNYPWLDSHPQQALAKRQQKSGGAVVSFEVKGGQSAAYELINATQLCSITANLGDTRTTITHPFTTTHARWSEELKAEVGISPSLIRLAVGLEDPQDILRDLGLG